MVEIEFLANLANKIGQAKHIAQPAPLSKILREFIAKVPDLLDLEGKPSTSYIFLINGVDSRVFGEDPELKDGDKVVVIPVSHGG